MLPIGAVPSSRDKNTLFDQSEGPMLPWRQPAIQKRCLVGILSHHLAGLASVSSVGLDSCQRLGEWPAKDRHGIGGFWFLGRCIHDGLARQDPAMAGNNGCDNAATFDGVFPNLELIFPCADCQETAMRVIAAESSLLPGEAICGRNAQKTKAWRRSICCATFST